MTAVFIAGGHRLGLEKLGKDYCFPTCPKFFNIFHPNDPIAYRFETLVDPSMVHVPPVVIPNVQPGMKLKIYLWRQITQFITRYPFDPQTRTGGKRIRERACIDSHTS